MSISTYPYPDPSIQFFFLKISKVAVSFQPYLLNSTSFFSFESKRITRFSSLSKKNFSSQLSAQLFYYFTFLFFDYFLFFLCLFACVWLCAKKIKSFFLLTIVLVFVKYTAQKKGQGVIPLFDLFSNFPIYWNYFFTVRGSSTHFCYTRS